MNYDISQRSSYYGFYFDISKEDYQKLKKDSNFLKLLSAIAFENGAVQSRAKRVENSILELIDQITIELQNK